VQNDHIGRGEESSSGIHRPSLRVGAVPFSDRRAGRRERATLLMANQLSVYFSTDRRKLSSSIVRLLVVQRSAFPACTRHDHHHCCREAAIETDSGRPPRRPRRRSSTLRTPNCGRCAAAVADEQLLHGKVSISRCPSDARRMVDNLDSLSHAPARGSVDRNPAHSFRRGVERLFRRRLAPCARILHVRSEPATHLATRLHRIGTVSQPV